MAAQECQEVEATVPSHRATARVGDEVVQAPAHFLDTGVMEDPLLVGEEEGGVAKLLTVDQATAGHPDTPEAVGVGVDLEEQTAMVAAVVAVEELDW
jgi:hypothetical protein